MDRREWYAVQHTHIQGSARPAKELTDREKKSAPEMSLLSARVTGEVEGYWIICDAALDHVPLKPELQYISKAHWSWPPPREWIAKTPAYLKASEQPTDALGTKDKIFAARGTRLFGRVIEELDEYWLISEGRIRQQWLSPHIKYVLKREWQLRPKPRPYDDASPLGYYYNLGGLNNQKLALLGLFVRAFELRRPIILPEMSVKDIASYTEYPLNFSEVFDIGRIFEFAKRHRIEVLTDNAADLPTGGWEYFGVGAGRVGQCATRPNEINTQSELVMDFMNSLVPSGRLTRLLERLKSEIFGTHGVGLASQFRIESDWLKHSEQHLKNRIKGPEDYYLPYDRIVRKIAKTMPSEKRILVICDEHSISVSKAEMKKESLEAFDVQLFFKSDFLTQGDLEGLNPLERSIIDFELATSASIFVGLTRSTFSNLVTFTKYSRSGKQVMTDYIYNNNSPELSQRTDNGGHDSPALATRGVISKN